MKQYKVCVYAICKNEEKFVDRWAASMKEADAIYVLDTGSTDQTVSKLKKAGVHVTQKKIDPWRFDVARNESLTLVPEDTDICICTDLDEVLETGWRKKVEKAWKKDTTRLRYTFNWSFDEYGKPAVSFYGEKIHNRKDYAWRHPVHEVVENITGNEVYVTDDKIVVNHYPDHTKSRGSYLPLLELSVEESPENDRNMHYLGREYMYYQKWNESIDTLLRHLHLKSATWKDERCASMRFIARDYLHLNRYDEAKMWYEKAIVEAPYLREPWVELGMLEYELKEYESAVSHLKNALSVTINNKTYINEPYCYDGTVEDVLSVCLFPLGKKEEALKYALKALEMKPNDQRIIDNVKFIEESLTI
ncbi:MAG: glycosyltransferase [Bacilli bacterium]|nr:glycosyltransferase [Bacilli bacterium]